MIFTPASVAFATILVILAAGYAVFSELPAREEPLAVPPQYEARLIELDRQAVEDAYRAQIQALFATWMKDGTSQPDRAIRGANIARKAYVGGMTALEERASKQGVKP